VFLIGKRFMQICRQFFWAIVFHSFAFR
jgi:hypothetical protein